jgi:hypothetical protein
VQQAREGDILTGIGDEYIGHMEVTSAEIDFLAG